MESNVSLICFSTTTTIKESPPRFATRHIYLLFIRICFIIYFPKQNVLKRSCCRTNQYLGVGDPTDNLYSFSPCFLYCCSSAVGLRLYLVSNCQVHCLHFEKKVVFLGHAVIALHFLCFFSIQASSQDDGRLLALQVTLQVDELPVVTLLVRDLQKWLKLSYQRRQHARDIGVNAFQVLISINGLHAVNLCGRAKNNFANFISRTDSGWGIPGSIWNFTPGNGAQLQNVKAKCQGSSCSNAGQVSTGNQVTNGIITDDSNGVWSVCP